VSVAVDEEERRRLLGVAYRMLGSLHDAEDAVQEGLVRWEQLGPDGRAQVREPAAWLTTVVSRVCLDALGSARARRERYTGVWLPEPVPGAAGFGGAALGGGALGPAPGPDPADVVTLEESVSMALLVAMEQLSAAERVALILHDAFGLPFDDVAEVVGRTPQACRQLASSARRHLRAQPRYAASGPERDAVVAAFARACEDGDLEALARVLDPGVVVRSDGGGVVSAARRPVVGAEKVARFVAGLFTKQAATGVRATMLLASVNGRTGLVVRIGGALVAVVDVAVADGAVHEIAVVAAPDKLASWREAPPA